MNTSSEKAVDHVEAGSTHGCASQLNIQCQILDANVEGDTVLTSQLSRVGAAAGENTSQTVTCAAKFDGLEVGSTVVGATYQYIQGMHRASGEAKTAQEVGIARVSAQAVHRWIHF